MFFFIVALIFVYRSFYGMRIPDEDLSADEPATPAPAEKKSVDRGLTKTATSGTAETTTVASRNR